MVTASKGGASWWVQVLDPASSTWGILVAAGRCSWCTGDSRGLGGSNAAPGGNRSAREDSRAACRCTGAASGWCNGRRAPSCGRRSRIHGRKTGIHGRRFHGCGKNLGSTSFQSTGKAVRKRERPSSWQVCPTVTSCTFLGFFTVAVWEMFSSVL